MCQVSKISDFNANAKQGHDLDDVRSIASFRGLSKQHVQDAIDAVGPDATCKASPYHLKRTAR